jgi:DNA-directed RNA polymerase subunit omega
MGEVAVARFLCPLVPDKGTTGSEALKALRRRCGEGSPGTQHGAEPEASRASAAKRFSRGGVVVSAKRARQINSYFHNLGEGGFGEYPPPMVETAGERNYLSMALEELAEGKLKYEYRA